MTDEQVRKQLADMVRTLGTQRAAAARLGVSTTYFADVRRGRQRAGPKILAALGLTRRDVYEAKR